MRQSHPICCLVLSLSFSLLVGCAGFRKQARSASEVGDLRRAIGLYDEAIASDPGDSESVQERSAARIKLADEILAAGERALLTDAFSVAESSFIELCTRRDGWGAPLEGIAALRFAALRDGVQGIVLAKIGDLAATGRFLDAANLRTMPAYACEGAAPVKQAVATRVGTLSTARCQALQKLSAEMGPYSESLAERACIAMGAAPTKHVALLPHQVGRVTVAGTLAGASDALLATLAQSVQKAGAQSILFADGAAAVLEITVAGSAVYGVNRTPTTLSHDWSETVPYEGVEPYQESYQEAYTDTEYYNVQVPYTRYSYVNGNSVPQTEYRTEQRQRSVTKYRTAFRTKTRPVTLYRQEARVFTHPAVHIEASYRANFAVEVRAPLLRTMSIPVAHSEAEDTYEHSASFGPASVSPSSGNVTSLESRFAQDVEAIRTKLFADWARGFAESACGVASGTFATPEAGAKCAWLPNSKTPDGAFLALVPLFGADISALPELAAVK